MFFLVGYIYLVDYPIYPIELCCFKTFIFITRFLVNVVLWIVNQRGIFSNFKFWTNLVALHSYLIPFLSLKPINSFSISSGVLSISLSSCFLQAKYCKNCSGTEMLVSVNIF